MGGSPKQYSTEVVRKHVLQSTQGLEREMQAMLTNQDAKAKTSAAPKDSGTKADDDGSSSQANIGTVNQPLDDIKDAIITRVTLTSDQAKNSR